MLSSGGGLSIKDRVKSLNKGPVKDPAASSKGAGAGNAGGRGLPDMRGKDYGTAGGSDMLNGASGMGAGMGSGVGVNVIVGAVNGIGLINQSGVIANRFRAKRQQIRDIRQGASMINNLKFKAPKGLAQKASNIRNNFRSGRSNLMQQSPKSNTLITGKVKSITAPSGKFYVPSMAIRGVSKIGSLMVGQMVTKKGTIAALTGRKAVNSLSSGKRMLANNPKRLGVFGSGTMGLPQKSNVLVNVNDVSVNKNVVTPQKFTGQMQNGMAYMQGLAQFSANPKVANLTGDQKIKAYNSFRILQSETFNAKQGNSIDTQKRNARVMSQVLNAVKMFPELNANKIVNISKNAVQRADNDTRRKQFIANQNANAGFDFQSKARQALTDSILSSSVSVARFDSYIKDNHLDEVNFISKERMEEIKQEAEDYVMKSKEIPLEKKEAAKELIEEQLMQEERDKNMESLRAVEIDRVIENPDEFKAILGEDIIEQFKQKLNEVQEEQQKKFVEEMVKQDNGETKDYLKKHPERRRDSYYDIYKARQQDQNRNYLAGAAMDLYGATPTDGQNQGIQPQPTSQSIYTSRQVQQQLSAGANG